MAQFDPIQRRETWLFQEIGRDVNTGQPIYRCLPYVLVSYDGDPVQYVEPSPSDEWVRSFDTNVAATGNGLKPIDARTEGLGRVAGIQYCTARPFEVFAYNDVDAALNIGQLP